MPGATATTRPSASRTEDRQALVRDTRLQPGVSGVAEIGLPFECAAAREGGERNGVLTAIEDFLGAHDGIRLAIVPAFFGLGVVWRLNAPWSQAVAGVVDPLDRNPLLAAMERNRVAHLVSSFSRAQELAAERAQAAKLRGLLARMLDSRAFSAAEVISRVRQRGAPVVSRAEIRDALGRRSSS